jgi:hypothetical protein
LRVETIGSTADYLQVKTGVRAIAYFEMRRNPITKQGD